MNRIRFGFVLLFLIVGRTSNVIAWMNRFNHFDPTVQIARDTTIGSFIWMDGNTSIARLSEIGDHTRIGANTKIDVNSHILQHVRIGSKVDIHRNVHVSNFGKIGDNVTLCRNVQMDDFAGIGQDGYIGGNSLIAAHAQLASGVRVENDTIIDRHASIGDNVDIRERAYIGKHTRIDQGEIVGPDAVIHEFANVHGGIAAAPKQVVIAAPSTQMLLNLIIEYPGPCSLTNAQRELSRNDDSVFNSSIMNLMTQQRAELIRSADSNPIRMPGLSCIVRLYLAGYYGQKRFDQLLERQRIGFDSMDQKDVFETYHFGPNATKTILSPEAQKEFVKLLTVQKESQRDLRTILDKRPEMIAALLGNGRDVAVTMPGVNTVISSNNYVVSRMSPSIFSNNNLFNFNWRSFF